MSNTPKPSAFDHVSEAPPDALFGLMAKYRADEAPQKVDLGIGAYRDDDGKPWVLPVVRKAEQLLRDDPEANHEYLPIAGLAKLTSAAQKLVLGADSPAILEKRAATFQTISGTGALHLGSLFLAKFYQTPEQSRPVLISDPTWANHAQIFGNVGLKTDAYPYWNKATRGLNLDGMLGRLREAPEGSIVLLHACAHNPTGVDPTKDEWKQIAEVMKEKKLFPFFDTAYQGFASGDLAHDAWAIRYFVEQGFELVVAESFAKNFGLYGERAGCFHFVGAPAPNAAEITKKVASQLAILQRSEISNPPAYGAKIASLCLNDPTLFAEWEDNLRTMSGRIIEMRKALYDKLVELKTPGDWTHIINQIGMFSFTGLTPAQVDKMIGEHHIYLTKNGRISMAGLNTKNIQYVAEAIHKVVTETA